MKEKLQSYVDYYFRFDEREDIEEVKAEVLGNLLDRYEEYLEKYDEEKAYVEAIKSMGNFQESEDIVEDPLLVDTGLLVSLVTAIFALVGVLFNNALGIVLVMVSISLFVASAYMLVGKAKVSIEEDKDVKKSKHHLRKIFSYMKASFTFWSITLSLLGAKLLYTVVLSLALVGGMNQRFYPEDLQVLLVSSFIIFVVLLIVFLVASRVLYKRLMHQYYLMTGDKDVESMVHSGLSFVGQASPNEQEEVRGVFATLFGGQYFVRIYLSILWIFALPFGMEIVRNTDWDYNIEYGQFFDLVFMTSNFEYSFMRVFLGLISLVFFILLALSYFWTKLSDKFLIFASYGLLMVYIVFALLAESGATDYYIQGAVFGYLVLSGLFSLIVFSIRMFLLPRRD